MFLPLAILLVALGGALEGLFSIPVTKTSRWEFENIFPHHKMKMKRIKNLSLLGMVMIGALCSSAASTPEQLEKEFVSPPTEAHPWCYWWWLNGAASKEGITRDFEEFKKQGISGALLFDAGEGGPDVPRGPHFMSPGWRELFKHAVGEANRFGIALSVNICTGWNAGGPWITQDHAAKMFVSAQTTVEGSKRIDMTLPQGAAKLGFHRDIAILATPAIDPVEPGLHSSSQSPGYPHALAMDKSPKTRWITGGDKPGMGPSPEKPEFLRFNYDQPRKATGLHLKPGPQCGPKEIEVQVSMDGKEFRPLKRTTLEQGQETTVSFDAVEARSYRVMFLSAYPFMGDQSWNVQVAEISLLPEDPLDKNLAMRDTSWDPQRTVDLGGLFDKDGRLVWDAPPGRWKILRIGYTLSGRNTVIAGSGPNGLELDPMSAEAMDLHFAETGAKLIADAGPLAGKTLQYLHIDSWEIGQPTWTPKMREEFQKRRGYDLLPWLPALCGGTVENAKETKRFLQDFRLTVADLVAENYYGRLQELALKGGLLGAHSEAGGPGVSWSDALKNHGRNTIPMGEFWARDRQPNGHILYGRNPSIKEISSAAHIYGKELCQAEAFTCLSCDFTQTPWTLKDIGDQAFSDGLTRNVFHQWIHQPDPDALLGNWWNHIGTKFGHTLTWWPMADGWLGYLARCQYMLRQGKFVGDFAYLQNEDIPSFVVAPPNQVPACPAGFEYDAINAEVLLTRVSAQKGRLMLPDGMSYRYLVLPAAPDAILLPATLKKINELAAAGVPVLGPNMRQGSLDAIVRDDGLLPDIEFRQTPGKARFAWLHRRDGETDIYFISNQVAEDIAAEVAFRVKGKQPELWDAVTGKIRDLTEWRTEAGRTVVPLTFAPRQSWFVVFRNPAKPQNATAAVNFFEMKPVLDLSGAWQVSFAPKYGGPEAPVVFDELSDWTEHADFNIKHYSGIATYRKTFNYPKPRTLNPLFLHLGTVKELARVRLNGKDLGVVWTAPWQVEITGAVKEGENQLEIEVANLWPNRLIGDASLPKEKRITQTNITTYDTPLQRTGIAGSSWAQRKCETCQQRITSGEAPTLLPSGLLGPVRLMTNEGGQSQ